MCCGRNGGPPSGVSLCCDRAVLPVSENPWRNWLLITQFFNFFQLVLTVNKAVANETQIMPFEKSFRVLFHASGDHRQRDIPMDLP
jgi:hypothetical protein